MRNFKYLFWIIGFAWRYFKKFWGCIKKYSQNLRILEIFSEECFIWFINIFKFNEYPKLFLIKDTWGKSSSLKKYLGGRSSNFRLISGYFEYIMRNLKYIMRICFCLGTHGNFFSDLLKRFFKVWSKVF